MRLFPSTSKAADALFRVLDALTHEDGKPGRNLRRARFAVVGVLAARSAHVALLGSNLRPRNAAVSVAVVAALGLVGLAAAASDADEQAWVPDPEGF